MRGGQTDVRAECRKRSTDCSQVEVAERHDVRALRRGPKGHREPVRVATVFSMGDDRARDDLRLQRVDVIQAHEVQRDPEEGEAEEAFVDLALDDLVRGATRPDRFADTASPA